MVYSLQSRWILIKEIHSESFAVSKSSMPIIEATLVKHFRGWWWCHAPATMFDLDCLYDYLQIGWCKALGCMACTGLAPGEGYAKSVWVSFEHNFVSPNAHEAGKILFLHSKLTQSPLMYLLGSSQHKEASALLSSLAHLQVNACEDQGFLAFELCIFIPGCPGPSWQPVTQL